MQYTPSALIKLFGQFCGCPFLSCFGCEKGERRTPPKMDYIKPPPHCTPHQALIESKLPHACAHWNLCSVGPASHCIWQSSPSRPWKKGENVHITLEWKSQRIIPYDKIHVAHPASFVASRCILHPAHASNQLWISASLASWDLYSGHQQLDYGHMAAEDSGL